MSHTRDLFNALVADDYSAAKEALHNSIQQKMQDRIETKMQDVRDQYSDSVEEE